MHSVKFSTLRQTVLKNKNSQKRSISNIELDTFPSFLASVEVFTNWHCARQKNVMLRLSIFVHLCASPCPLQRGKSKVSVKTLLTMWFESKTLKTSISPSHSTVQCTTLQNCCFCSTARHLFFKNVYLNQHPATIIVGITNENDWKTEVVLRYSTFIECFWCNIYFRTSNEFQSLVSQPFQQWMPCKHCFGWYLIILSSVVFDRKYNICL